MLTGYRCKSIGLGEINGSTIGSGSTTGLIVSPFLHEEYIAITKTGIISN
jgi:hypothetical protein